MGGFPVSKSLYAALWKSSIWRIQLVRGFHLGQIWATILRSPKANFGSVNQASATTRRMPRRSGERRRDVLSSSSVAMMLRAASLMTAPRPEPFPGLVDMRETARTDSARRTYPHACR